VIGDGLPEEIVVEEGSEVVEMDARSFGELPLVVVDDVDDFRTEGSDVRERETRLVVW